MSELNMDYINSIIIQHEPTSTSATNTSTATSNSLPIKYINCVPKIQYHKYKLVKYSDNNSLIMLIDLDNPELDKIQQLPVQYIQKQYKLFYVNEIILNNIINEIITTTGKYVYPMIFVNYLKQTLKINEKVNFDNSLLLYLRIWSNQIRELSCQDTSNSSNNGTSTSSSTNGIFITDKMRYIGYRICCELLYYYKYIHHSTNSTAN